MFKRKIYNQLLDWKNTYNGQYAVLVEGARRVGKSTVVEEFAKKEYKSYIMIDFSKAGVEIKNIFNNISDLDLFFLRLQAESNVELYERNSVIIFDEVQLFPLARQAIKHLVADGKYDYIETGSLISIKKNVKNILLPSEEIKINMYPMDYEEFLWASNNPNYRIIKELVESNKPIGEDINRKLMSDFRIYMAVGGMPQAVKAYVDKKSFQQIDLVKREIIDLYMDDFRKIDSTGRVGKIFESIPSQLALNKKRFFISKATNSRQRIKDEERLSDLIDSKTVNICYNSKNPSISLFQSRSEDEYKLYLLDTGLFVTLLFNSEEKTHEDIYKKLLSNSLPENLGFLYENVVAQMISSTNKKLYYHFWPKEKNGYYEIDFILTSKTKIIPIEVKSSRVKPHNSLDKFKQKYSKYIYEEWIVSQHDIANDNEIRLWPIYCLPILLENL